jgi:hypothetical protein
MYELGNINCSLYFTTHTLRSGLQFIFHNSYITLRLAVYISQLIHYINCKPERDVYVVKYKLQAWAWCMSCDIWTVSLSVMYELGNINCKSETLRLTVYISQLIHYAQTYCLYFTTHTSRSGLQFIFHNSHITLNAWVVIYKLQAWAWGMSCEI